MALSEDIIINRLLQVEAMAEGLRKECYKTRMLITKEGVSTSSDDQPLSQEEVALIIAKRRNRLFKKTNKRLNG